MKADALPNPDRKQIATLVQALFKHAAKGTYVSLRSFPDDDSTKPFEINCVLVDDRNRVIEAAWQQTQRAAKAERKIVFCPPVATFSNKQRAGKADVADGLTLTAECDKKPQAARQLLEELLGPATLAVESGGEWTNPETGELEAKLHLHWRLNKPARGNDRARLEEARKLVIQLVDSDPSHGPISHPIRWPGSLHRKGQPKLCRIIAQNGKREIVLETAHAALQAAAPAASSSTNGNAHRTEPNWSVFITAVLSAESYHEPLMRLAAKLLASGMDGGAAVNFLRGLMESTSGPHDARWQARYDDIPRAIKTARERYGQEQATAELAGIEPVDLWGQFEPPALPRELLPKVIEDYAFTTGMTMGADPAGLAMAALTVCGAAIDDAIKLQMKKHSEDWNESARFWTALVGLPSFKKTPAMMAAARVLRKRDHELLRRYQFELKRYQEMEPAERKGCEPPLQQRLCLEDTTIEAAQEVLVGSPNGVLLYQDKLSGFFGGMDKYSGNRGAAKDRAFWLQSWSGGPYGLNRIGRGVSMIPNLSISLLGGIQPDVIRKISAESHDDGFLARMLIIMARAAVMGTDEKTQPVAATYAELVERLTELTPPTPFGNIPVPLSFDAGAQNLRGELERKHLELAQQFEMINKKLAAAIGKYDGYFGRLCLLWHCIEHANEKKLPQAVTEKTARRVADFMDRFMRPHAVAFYCGVLGLADEHDRLASVAGYILAHRLEKVTNRDIQRGDRMRGLKRRDTDSVCEQLEALGWVTRTPGPRQGLHWIVNPTVHIRFAERAAKEAARRAATRELILNQVRGGAHGS